MLVAASGHTPCPEQLFAAAPVSRTWCCGRDCAGCGVLLGSTQELKSEKRQGLKKLVQWNSGNKHSKMGAPAYMFSFSLAVG